jgi:hypothetical protein
MEWIAAMPCLVCDWRGIKQTTFTEVAHVGTRGLSQKCSDRETVPLCVIHHRTGPEAHHKLGRRFWVFHGLILEKLLKHFNDRYEQEKAA